MRKSFPFEFKSLDEQTGAFTGLASVYGNVDLHGDIVERGAFAKSIARKGREIPLLWQHRMDMPIGTGRLEDSDAGLLIHGQLTLDVALARECYALMKARVVKGLSIGYDTVAEKVVNGVRHLTEIDLWEVSAVTFPANPLAQVDRVKVASSEPQTRSTMDMNSLLTEQAKTYGLLQAALARQADESKAMGRAHADTVAKVQKIANVIADLEVKMQRAAIARPVAGMNGADRSVEVKAYEKYLRYGLAGRRTTDADRKAFYAFQGKALSVGDDERGGFFVPEDVRADVVKRIPHYSGIGQFINRASTGRDIVRWPRLLGGNDIKSNALTVTYEDETDSVTETDFTTGSVAIKVCKGRVFLKISNELLEDEAIDIVSLINELAAEAFGQDEELQITIGGATGAAGKTPLGFMVDTDIVSINSGVDGGITFDNFVDLVTLLSEQHARNARFIFKRSTMAHLLKIKVPQFSGDSAGVPLWQPSMRAGVPSTILGAPISIVEYMPAIATGACPVAFGDLRQLYTAVDRTMRVQRLDEKYAENDQTAFIFRRRWGGRPVAPWALKKLRASA